MPRFDRTGPMGQGPRTGRGLGCCNCKFRMPTPSKDESGATENKEKATLKDQKK